MRKMEYTSGRAIISSLSYVWATASTANENEKANAILTTDNWTTNNPEINNVHHSA
jgi:hypothetical protein